MSVAKFIDIKVMRDDRGSLISLEGEKNIPFSIKRVYCIFETKPNAVRGFHAHFNLKQVVICLSGKCTFILDDGRIKEEVVLDNSANALVIDKMIWREMKNFSSDCVLMVLASEYYDESDYIRKYNEFLKIIKHDSLS